MKTMLYDIALLKLKSPLTFSGKSFVPKTKEKKIQKNYLDKVGPICSPHDMHPLADKEKVNLFHKYVVQGKGLKILSLWGNFFLYT